MADLTGMLQAAAGNTGNPNAWDISKAAYDASPDPGDVSKAFYSGQFLDSNSQDTNPSAFAISADGTTAYVLGVTTDTVYQYTLASSWNVAGATYASKSFSVASQATSPFDMVFKPDGTKMYILDQSSDFVYQYSLSTAWDVSTASYDSVSFSTATEDTSPSGLFIKPDGTKMYITGGSGDDVNEYDLSTPWDVSSASYVQNFSVATQSTTPNGVSFLSDGTKMYITQNGTNPDDTLIEYSLSTPWDISSASFVQEFSLALQIGIPRGVFLKPDGSIFYITAPQDHNTNSISRTFQYPIGGFSVAAQDTSPQGIFFKPDGTKMYIVGLTGDAVYEYNLSTDWDITTASYLQNFSVSGQEANPSDLFFKDDGTKMYIIGTAGDDVNEYSLSVAWDISSASYTTNFSVASQELGPNALFFKPDGTKMYVVGQGNDTVYQYSLSTAWDVSSASYDSVSFSIAAQETTPQGLSFKPDGTKMYVLGSAGDDVNEYDLSTPWDVSSASYVQNVGVLDATPTGLYWRDNGEEFFVICGGNNDLVQKYTISST